jgi:hypothetical protein
MLITKINPPAIKIVETTPFSSTTKNLDYMTAVARPYTPGAPSTNFQIQFGSVVLNENEVIVRFNNETSSQITMTSEELSDWGTNDEVLLELIAAKLNVSILETINVPGGNF